MEGLVDCGACGAAIRRTATACPYCGRTRNGTAPMGGVLVALAIACLFFALMVGLNGAA